MSNALDLLNASNINVVGEAHLANVYVHNTAKLYGNTIAFGPLSASNDLIVSGTLTASNVSMTGNVALSGDI